MTKYRRMAVSGLVAIATSLSSLNAQTPLLERPADVWGYLRDAAAANGAAPDDTLTYEGALGQTHKIEVFYPADPVDPGPYPGVVLFHGGAWREGSPIQFYRQARAVADAGFVVALPEYSVSNQDNSTPRDSLIDAFRAWAVVHSSAHALMIKPEVIYAGGASAGGQMAAALATVPAPEATPAPRQPAGLVLFNPVIDNGPDGYGYARVKTYWESFSPLHNIGKVHPHTLLMVGDADKLIPVNTAEAYCEKVRQTGSACAVEVFANAGHAWFNWEPNGYAATLRSMLEFLTANDTD